MPNSDPNDGFSLFCGAFIVLSSPSIGMKWLGEDHPTVIPYNSCPVYISFLIERTESCRVDFPPTITAVTTFFYLHLAPVGYSYNPTHDETLFRKPSRFSFFFAVLPFVVLTKSFRDPYGSCDILTADVDLKKFMKYDFRKFHQSRI